MSMVLINIGLIVSLLVIGILLPFYAVAQPKLVHGGDKWTAWVIKEKKLRICYLHGTPYKSTGKYKRRGQSYLQVTQRPEENILDEVSITAGYIYKKDSKVIAVINGKKQSLFTNGETAWAPNPEIDRSLVKAMRSGRELLIKGISSRGTLTTDRYSLIGFSVAYRAARKACSLK